MRNLESIEESPAPFTPATLMRLRSLALNTSAGEIARLLGWRLDRVRHVARDHGIELFGAHATIDLMQKRVVDTGNIGLSDRQRQALDILQDCPLDMMMTAYEIGGLLEPTMQAGAVRAMLAALDRKLMSTQWTVRSTGGSYWLAQRKVP